MIKSFITFLIAFIFSFTIVGQSLITLMSSDAEITVVQDVKEDVKKKTQNELDENEKYLDEYVFFSLEDLDRSSLLQYSYIDSPYNYVLGVHSPPPDFI